MPVRAILLALAAIMVAGIVYFYAQRLLTPTAAATPTQAVAGVVVLVAGRALAAGVPIGAADVVWRSWPTDGVDASYLRKGASGSNIAGQIPRVAYAAGQPLSRDTLARQGDAGALAVVIAPGMRAVSLAVNAASGVSGLIMPGDRVDVVLTHSLPRAPDATFERRAAVTLVRDRRVLAVEQRLGQKSDAAATPDVAANPIEPRTASLEVSPREAEKLALAAELGKLTLVLRPLQQDSGSTDGGRTAPTRDSDLDPLFAAIPRSQVAIPAPAAGPAMSRPAGPRRSVPTIYRGSQADTGAAQ